jgi:polyhydroxyalkanoate synthesis regulator phasin
MTDIDRIEERLSAVERTVVDGDYELTELTDLASLAADVEELESRLDSLEQRFAELEASAKATQGYVSNIESVNEDVEQQADAAIAAVDRLEERIGTLEATLEHKQSGQEQSDTAAAGTNGEDGSKSTGSFSPDLEASPNPTNGASKSPQPSGNNSPSPVSAADQAAVEESVSPSRPENTDDEADDDDGFLHALVAKLPP